MENLVRFYKGKKVFITGHTGFKGGWLLLWLHLMGAEIKGFSLAPSQPNSFYRLVEGDELCLSVIHDIRDQSFLESEILSFQPDVIFHLAAQPLVRLSYQIPKETFDVNINGTINLLESLKKLAKQCHVVLVTTDKVYAITGDGLPFNEEDKLGGYDPYSASKASVEIIASSYRNSFFSPNKYELHKKGIAVARSGNVIGGGDWSCDRLMPDIVNSLMASKPIILRNPKSIRPWQYVLDPILGYLKLGSALETDSQIFSSAFNFGPDLADTLTVEEFVKAAIYFWGEGAYHISDQSDAPHETNVLKLDNSKTKNTLKHYPTYGTREAIEKTISWYKYSGPNHRDYSRSQILEFINALH